MGGYCHFLKRVLPVGRLGMIVESAPQILILDELRQIGLLGQLQLVDALSHFRGDIFQTQRIEEVGFLLDALLGKRAVVGLPALPCLFL